MEQTIPYVDLDRVLGRPWIGLPYEDGALPDSEAMALLDIVWAERPHLVLEIGTFMGATTRRLAEMMGRWDGVVMTVDLPGGVGRRDLAGCSDPHLILRRDVGREFRGAPCESRIIQVLCDTWEWDFRPAMGANLVFIDGSHTYQYCDHDSRMVLDVVAGGGGGTTIVWHDADPGHPGVLRVLGEWRRAGRDVRIIKGTRLAYWRVP